MNVLCVIPARSGSTRIRDKNLSEINGASLVRNAYTIAEESDCFSDIVVSSDAQRMADGLPWVERPLELSGPTADIAAASQHALLEMERRGKLYEYVVTLQPTVPVRNKQIVKLLLERVVAAKAKGGLTGVKVVPWLWREKNGHALNDWTPGPYPRSQVFEGMHLWQEINAVQVADRETVLAGKRWDLPLLIQLLPAFAVVDIDDEVDLKEARLVLPKILDCLEMVYDAGFFLVNTAGRQFDQT